jgi:hypothetical protein
MANISNILKEISSVSRFVSSRVATTGLACDPTLLSSFSTGLIKMINEAPSFGASEGGLVNQALKDSPYGEPGTTNIVAAVDRRCSSTADACSARGTRKSRGGAIQASSPKQTIMHWWNYPTQEDWDFVNDPARSWDSKVCKMVERANAIGLGNPDEQAEKWMLAMLLLIHYRELPSYKEIYSKLLDLKKAFISERRTFGLEHITQYPEQPRDLPPSVYASAYPAGGAQPVAVQLHGVRTVADHIPLRKNSKLLKGPKKAAELADVSFGPAGRSMSGEPAKSEPHLSYSPLASVDAAPQDDEEKLLWLDYQQKMLQLKQKKQQMQQPVKEELAGSEHTDGYDTAAAARPVRGSIRISRSSDGSLKLFPREQDELPPPSAVSRRVMTKQPVKADADAAGEADAAPTEDDLDPYTRQAIAALHSRVEKDKAEKAAAKKSKRKSTAEPAAESAPKVEPPAGVSKRPAAKEAVAPASKAKKEKHLAPAAAKPKSEKQEPVEATAANVAKMLPAKSFPTSGTNPPPVLYNGGVIYTSIKEQKFRALGVRGDRYTETGASWKKVGIPEAWKFAYNSIDAFRKRLGEKKVMKTMKKKKKIGK